LPQIYAAILALVGSVCRPGERLVSQRSKDKMTRSKQALTKHFVKKFSV